MKHVIVWIGGTVVHGEGQYGEAAGRVVIEDMLSKGSGEHVLRSSDDGGEDYVRGGGALEWRIYGGYWWGNAPSPVGHIGRDRHGLTLVPARLSPGLVPCDTDGPARSARRPFS